MEFASLENRHLYSCFQHTLELVNEPICILSRDGKVIFQNSAFKNLLGDFSLYDQLQSEFVPFIDSHKQKWTGDFLYKGQSLLVQTWKSFAFDGKFLLINKISEANSKQNSSSLPFPSDTQGKASLVLQNDLSLECYQNFVELDRLPCAIGIWHLEEIGGNVDFRLISLNRTAKTRMLPPEIQVGRTITELVQQPHNLQINKFFRTVIQSQREIVVEHFSLNENSSFSITAFSLPHECVGVLFNKPNADEHTLTHLIKSSFDYHPSPLAIFRRIDDQFDFSYVTSNKTLQQFLTLTPSDRLSQFAEVLASEDMKRDIAKPNENIGKVVKKFMVNGWANNAGLFRGIITNISPDHILVEMRQVTSTSLQEEQAALQLATNQVFSGNSISKSQNMKFLDKLRSSKQGLDSLQSFSKKRRVFPSEASSPEPPSNFPTLNNPPLSNSPEFSSASLNITELTQTKQEENPFKQNSSFGQVSSGPIFLPSPTCGETTPVTERPEIFKKNLESMQNSSQSGSGRLPSLSRCSMIDILNTFDYLQNNKEVTLDRETAKSMITKSFSDFADLLKTSLDIPNFNEVLQEIDIWKSFGLSSSSNS